MAWQNRRFNNTRSTYTKRTPEVIEFRAPSFEPSPAQRAVMASIRDNFENIIVGAVAGSGKTTTLAFLVSTLLDLKLSYVVLAFNKSIATELQSRGMNGKTFHSCGFSTVANACTIRNNGVRPEMDAKKVANIIANTYQNADGYAGALERLVSLAKNHMMRADASNESIVSLIEHFDIEWDDTSITDDLMCDAVRTIMAKSIADLRTLDFDDQLYLVWLFDLRMPTYDVVLVDESQDTNPLRRDLVKRMMHRNSRVVAVGDPRQAIYGFTGASHDSMDLIASDFDCVTYPLNKSYRCARSIVREAQRYVPNIEWDDNAPEGSVTTAATFKRSDFLPTDMIVCRNTAPIVGVAYKLLSARIPCRVMGREIGKSLTSLIKRLSRKNETLETLYDRLQDHKATEVSKAMRQRKESKAQAVTDKVDAICAILDSLTPEDSERGIPGLVAIIDGMFSDTKNGCVTLATVHKSKGLEAPRVFILDRQLMPSKMAKQEWQIAQEYNLIYVAITRAMRDLVYLDSKNLTD